jgi:hypothetical protein
MFEHSGAKLKIWAKIVAWVGIIASFVVGFAVMYGGMGILIIVGGSLASWIVSLFIYTFGDISEQTEAIRKTLDALKPGENTK